jgi:4-hydroxy-tetrahydrodipicolinate synthase
MITGLITPILTPFHRDAEQSINYEGTKALVDHLIAAGVSGLFALGSNGEFAVLSYQEKIDFVKKVIEFAAGRVPVYAGTGCCSTRETISLSREMEKLGVDGISVIAPYFAGLSEDEMYAHYAAVAGSVSIPVILYNIPRLTGNPLTPAVVERLAKIRNITCIKDSSRDIENLKAYIKIAAENDMTVLIGSDSLILEGMKLGAHGAIAGLSNVLAHNLVALYQAIVSENLDEAQKLQDSIKELSAVNRKGTMPCVLKRSVELANIADVGPGRLPAMEADERLDADIREMLKHYGIL